MKRAASVVALCALALTGCGKPQEAPPEALSTPAYVRAVAILQTQARSTDPAVRANCIEALQAATKDPRSMDVIEAGLHDEVWVVRFAAAMASGKRKSTAVRPVLETMAVADPSGSVRVAAIYALSRIGHTEHMQDLATALESPDPSTRANTALVLGMMGNPSAIPLLQARKDDVDVRVRFELTSALARLGDPQAEQIIISWAINRTLEGQLNAMVVCADLPGSVASGPLRLGMEPGPQPGQGQPALSDTDKDELTRRQLVAARSLAKLHYSDGAKVAIDGLKNPNPNLRALAVLALGEMLAPEQLESIVPMLNDPNDTVQRATAAAIIEVFARMSPS
jgi:HEAT repeat protein